MLNNLQQIQKFLHPDCFYLLYFNCRKKDIKSNYKNYQLTKLISYNDLIYNYNLYKQIADKHNSRIYINLYHFKKGETPSTLSFPATIIDYSYYNTFYKQKSKQDFLITNNYFTIDLDYEYLKLEKQVKDIIQDSYVYKMSSKTGFSILCNKLTINQIEDILKLNLSINTSWCVNLYIPNFE